MTRLIVEDGGKRRAFRLNEGRLTIGSGAGCVLKLESAGVAEVHAELELAQGRATLVPRPGVVPPQVDGRAAQGPVVLADGARVAIGAALIVLQREPTDPTPPPAPAARTVPAAAARTTPAAAARTPAAAPPSTPATRVQPSTRASDARPERSARVPGARSERSARAGVPTWMILVGIGGALVVAVLVFGKLWERGASGFDPAARLATARAFFESGNQLAARQELGKLTGVELPVALADQVETLVAELDAADAARDLLFHHEEGSEFLETQLKRFETERMQGKPGPEVVRVFLKRCREFRERWPKHPEMEWVDRHEDRLRGFVDLSAPPTYRDVEYEIESLTWAKPRDYELAFRLLDDFAAKASGSDVARVDALRAKLVEERAAYFEDRMQQAAFHWRREEKGQAVEWLAQVVMKIGDEAMAEEAARELTLLPGVEGWLRGYKTNRPDLWTRLTRQPLLRQFAEEHGI